MRLRWDIFCTVIDNFGDIGIGWRLARQLSDEFGQQVRLWVDDLESFQRLEPRLDTGAGCQIVGGVEIRHWRSPLPDIEPAQVVVEALACRLPEDYLNKMAALQTRPVWINLEYLSAEDWVKECHGLASPHPRLPLKQTFFIPGFGPGTGGLLGSPLQHEDLAAWRQQPGMREQFLASIGVECRLDYALAISLFAYDNAAIPGLLEALAQLPRPVCLVVPEGKASARVAAWLGGSALQPGQTVSRAQLTIHAVPFLEHGLYDRLLWTCDLNCVRGEDSFIQAQWAARPLVWQPYIQEDGAHWGKLDAFVAKYQEGLEPATAMLLEEAWRVWNAGESRPATWLHYLGKLPELRRHAIRWSALLKTWPNLASELVKFVEAEI